VAYAWNVFLRKNDDFTRSPRRKLVEKVDELYELVKHLLHGKYHGKSKSGKSESKSGKSEGKIVFVDVMILRRIPTCTLPISHTS